MNDYQISYDHSMVIDGDGIIQYSASGVPLANIQAKIDELLSTSIVNDEITPQDFALFNNYPNPFNPVTTIRYQIPQQVRVNLSIINVSGQKIATLVNEEQPAGSYSVNWQGKDDNGNSVASGVYFFQLRAESFFKVNKMLLLR